MEKVFVKIIINGMDGLLTTGPAGLVLLSNMEAYSKDSPSYPYKGEMKGYKYACEILRCGPDYLPHTEKEVKKQWNQYWRVERDYYNNLIDFRFPR